MARRKIDFIRSQPVALPNGLTMRISYIRHRGAVIIVPFLTRNKIVFMRQFRPVLNKHIFELPAGTIDPDESLMTCAKRELKEETGLSAKSLKKLGQIYPVPGYSTEIIYIFKAENLVQGEALPEEYEVIENIPMTKAEVRTMFRKGVLQDAKSICALAHCGWL